MAGVGFGGLNAGQPWSLTAPDPNTIRLELRPQDHWANDYSKSVQRTEVTFTKPVFHVNEPIEIKYGLTVEPGQTSTASWLVLNQINLLDEPQNPPFQVSLRPGDHLAIQIRTGSSDQGTILWEDPNPIQRGHEYQMAVQAKFGSDGYLIVTRDGQQIVNYHGPMTLGDHPMSWNLDIYRPNSPQTMAVDFSHTQITTSSGTVFLTSDGWETTQPSDWTSATVPPPPTSTETDSDTGTGKGQGDGTGPSGGSKRHDSKHHDKVAKEHHKAAKKHHDKKYDDKKHDDKVANADSGDKSLQKVAEKLSLWAASDAASDKSSKSAVLSQKLHDAAADHWSHDASVADQLMALHYHHE